MFTPQPNRCLNCGAPLSGEENYCPVCGQETRIKRLSISTYLSQWFNSLISLDSAWPWSIWATIIRPHSYAKDFIEGKRKKYTHPFKLFVNITIVFFLFQTFLFQRQARRQDRFKNYLQQVSAPGSRFSIQFQHVLDSIFADKDYNSEKKKDEAILKGIHMLDAGYSRFFRNDSSISANISIQEIPFFYQYFLIAENQLNRYLHSKTSGVTEYHPSEKIIEQIFGTFLSASVLRALKLKIRHPRWTEEEILEKSGLKPGFTAKTKLRLAYKIYRLFTDINSPRAFMDYLISKMTVVLFLFLPFYAMFFRLLFRSPYNFTEILVFLAIVQSFFLMLKWLMDLWGASYSSLILILVFGIYYFLALKRFFHTGPVKTFFRWLFSGILYLVLLSLFIAMEVVVSLYFV